MASVANPRGRGIGRGRGFGIPKGKPGETQTTDPQKNSSNVKLSDGFDLVKVLNDLRDDDTWPAQVQKISQYITDSDSSTRIKELVDHLTQRTIKNSEFAPLAAKVANKLCSDESFGNAFRADLLKSTQEHYKKRQSIREKSLTEWIGLAGLICELFNHLRSTGDVPLKPLAGAVHQTMSELLREGQAGGEVELEMDEIDCFYEHFKTAGELLESVNQEKAEELVTKIRDTILADNTTAKTRCLLMELLELRTGQWKISPDVEKYYCDMLADIMANQS